MKKLGDYLKTPNSELSKNFTNLGVDLNVSKISSDVTLPKVDINEKKVAVEAKLSEVNEHEGLGADVLPLGGAKALKAELCLAPLEIGHAVRAAPLIPSDSPGRSLISNLTPKQPK